MKTSRNVYLKMMSLEQAREVVFNHFPDFGNLPGEKVSVPDAVGRVLSEPVFAKMSSPNFHAAAMDGIAVKAETTFGVSESHPKELTIGKDAFYVNTGHVLPHETDAVIMIEQVQLLADNQIRIEAPAFPWQHVRKMGEDIVATELLFARNHEITPYCVGALLSAGIFEASVRRKPKILIIPTGSELVDWRSLRDTAIEPGKVLETNAYMLGNMIQACGGDFTRHEKLSDHPELISKTLQNGIDQGYDAILTVGGSSAGSEDYTRSIIADLGEVLIHGVTMMPGKPVIIGKIRNTPIFGIPGYPVSAIMAFEQFVRPLIRRMLGVPDFERSTAVVMPTRKIASKLGMEEFLRVKLGKVGDRIVATPLPGGAGCITSLTEADGIIRIPNHVEGINESDSVVAELLRPLSSIHRTIVVVGSHDNTLDVLTDLLKAKKEHLTLSSSHVGSLGGLRAIKRGVCHLAGSHLLDTETGAYNVSYIRRYLPDVPVKRVRLVDRDQGLIVARGNPKRIQGIEDLSRKDVRFINRQAGSGTRVLLDYRLNELSVSPDSIQGYETEEYTHMTVAVAVLSGAADAGLGIYAAAKALNLDFIPVVTEEYDLIIPEIFFDTENIKNLLGVICSLEFKQSVDALGGYHTENTGKMLD